jgi:hypothetical protein
MRIGLHLPLLFVGQIFGFVVGPLLVWKLSTVTPAEFRSGWMSWLDICVMGAASVVGVFGMRLLLRGIRARCPKCGGAAAQEGIRPYRYRCEMCGHTQETRVSSNW